MLSKGSGWCNQSVSWCWRVFSCKCRSLWVISWLTAPQGKYQPHPGSVCAWWEGSLEAVNCNVTTAASCTHGATGQALLLGIWCWGLAVLHSWSMDAWLAVLQTKWITVGTATKTKSVPRLRTWWYLLILQVWGREHRYRLWPQAVSGLGGGWWPLMDEWRALRGGSTPQRGSQDTAALLSFCTLHLQGLWDSAMSHLWKGSWHKCGVASRLSSTLNSSHSLLQCWWKQRLRTSQHLEPHNFWLKQNKEQRELLEGVCTSERIIKLCPWGERAPSCSDEG